MMAALEARLEQEDIKFDHIQNRGRCFPHVVNIAVQTALKMLSKSVPNPDPMCRDEVVPTVNLIDTAMIPDEDQVYAEVLKSDPVGKC
ncbi:hypothetical protein EWM64_g9530 [Hericium alpestre]|uniref:Uncharacterized protein n=1 Tax=Hericium alpestre TaxID=135208 RepID=A0A4Y9ZKQ6_9AGAM|nr:hypothetical protein EWM64_g9530 [Hericium alpestre]